jgi:tRNA A-37 threonylcarbamoyl transferase component Bud32
MAVGGPLAGTLSQGGLLDLLRLLHRTSATGVVHVIGSAPIQVHLRQGSIRAAFFGGYVGPSALTRAIIAGIGPYRLAEAPAGVPRNIPHDTAFLLDSVAKVLADIAVEQKQDPADENPFFADDDDNSLEQTERFEVFAPPESGVRFGKCVLGQELGRGASSIVYKAHHEALDIPVVVKVLMDSAKSPARRMTANEAHLLARLNHPNIVRVFDFDDSAAHPHLIVEYIDGPGLNQELFRHGKVPASLALPWFRQVTEALSYAWDTLQLVHCDLKPDNILLAGGTVAKLADLGLAKSARGGALFGEDVVGGTPSYIAPEQVESGHAAVDRRSDIYALGATFYHVLLGRPPFIDDDPIQLMCRRLHEAPIPPHVLDPASDRRLSDLLMGMLARHPEDRIADYDAILDALDSLIEAQERGDSGAVIVRRRTSFWRNASRLFGRDGSGA